MGNNNLALPLIGFGLVAGWAIGLWLIMPQGWTLLAALRDPLAVSDGEFAKLFIGLIVGSIIAFPLTWFLLDGYERISNRSNQKG